jgi:hypothetical protein
MKFFILFAILSLTLQASAWVSTNSAEKVYSFKYRLKGEVYEISQSSGTYEEAFERASKDCFRHFKNGQRLSEDQGLDIIDVCANPRTT